MELAILYQDGLKDYDFGSGHPFRGDRFGVFMRLLGERLEEGRHYRILAAEAAGDEDLLLICERDYIEFTRRYYEAVHLGKQPPGHFSDYHSVDNIPSSGPGNIEKAGRLIVGQAKTACDLVQSGAFAKAVSIGGGLHHAKPYYGEGFCVYNDVAFCARYLLNHHGLERVLVLDTDAHAGNGTSDYFYDEPRVLFIDIHQDPRTVYPGTGYAQQIGIKEGTGFTVNIPMPVGAGDASYALAFERVIEPVCREFRPQIIIRNGGSDPHFADRLTNLGLSVAGFRTLGRKVREMAEVCEGKVVDLLTSGYNLTVLPFAWLSLICGLAELDVPVEEPHPPPPHYLHDTAVSATEAVIDEVRRHLGPYWACLR